MRRLTSYEIKLNAEDRHKIRLGQIRFNSFWGVTTMRVNLRTKDSYIVVPGKHEDRLWIHVNGQGEVKSISTSGMNKIPRLPKTLKKDIVEFFKNERVRQYCKFSQEAYVKIMRSYTKRYAEEKQEKLTEGVK